MVLGPIGVVNLSSSVLRGIAHGHVGLAKSRSTVWRFSFYVEQMAMRLALRCWIIPD
jgi:hypothetical protein